MDDGEGVHFTSKKLSPSPPSPLETADAGSAVSWADSLPWQAPFSPDDDCGSIAEILADEREARGDEIDPEIVTLTSQLLSNVPPLEWIVRDWIPYGVVTALYGDGGLGKTLLSQQLQTAAAVNSRWLDLAVMPVSSLGIYCEDDLRELLRRQTDINNAYNVDADDVVQGGAHFWPRKGKDNILMTFSRNGVGELTRFHARVLSSARAIKARLVVFDTATDGFAGNENDRGQVRQFISRALGSIAEAIDGSVLLCAHPSRSGIASGDGSSASTGWSNSVRSRLYLKTPEQEPGDAPDDNARILQRWKANYASRKDEIRLRWHNGVIEPEAPVAPGATPFGKLPATDVFINLLRQFAEQDRPVSDNSKAGNFAPRMFAKQPRTRRVDFREPDFVRAMEQLFSDRQIENVEYGRPSAPRRKIVQTEEPERRGCVADRRGSNQDGDK